MNNRAYTLKRYIKGDKLLSPLELISISDEMGLSIDERYILQKQHLMDKFKHTKIGNELTGMLAKDIVREIEKVFKK